MLLFRSMFSGGNLLSCRRDLFDLVGLRCVANEVDMLICLNSRSWFHGDLSGDFFFLIQSFRINLLGSERQTVT